MDTRIGDVKQIKSATCWTCREHGAELNGNWRGGRAKHKAGYVMVRLSEHPRARTHGYVFEHILVMKPARADRTGEEGRHPDDDDRQSRALGTRETRGFGEFLIDLEEKNAARAVVFGLLAELERK